MITAGGVSDFNLKFGYWYLTHKNLLRQILIYLMFFINLNLFIFVIYYVANTYYFDRSDFISAINQLGNSRINYSTFNLANQPVQLGVSNVRIFKNIGSTYDIMANLRNDNKIWIGQVMGRFKVGEMIYEDKVINVLPNSSRIIAQIGLSDDLASVSPEFIIDSIKWERVSNQDEFNRLLAEKNNFKISNIVYQSPNELKSGTQVPVNGVSFEIENHSLYDYWNVEAEVLFKRGAEIIAVDLINIEEFKTGQFRKIDFRVFGNLSGVTSVEVVPYVDIYDLDNIIEKISVLGEEK